MFEMPEVMRRASALSAHAAARQAAVAENVANADTPGYRAADLPDFAETYRDRDAAAMRATRAGHLGAASGPDSDAAPVARRSGSLSPDGNGVSLEREMVAAADVRREHDMALAVYRSALGILRTSLGRA